jgi:hypothetical protein
MEATSIGRTEYSLHWLFVVEQGLADLCDWADVPLYMGIWAPEQLSTLDMDFIKRAFVEDPEVFLIIQSNLELPLDSLISLFSGFIQTAPEDNRLRGGVARRLSRLASSLIRRKR